MSNIKLEEVSPQDLFQMLLSSAPSSPGRSAILQAMVRSRDKLTARALAYMVMEGGREVERESLLGLLRGKMKDLSVSESLMMGAYGTEFLWNALERVGTFQTKDWIQLEKFLQSSPKEIKEAVLNFLFQNKVMISQLGLVILAIHSAVGAPAGYQELLQLILTGEINKNAALSPVIISLPQGIQCSLPVPISSSSPNKTDAPLHYFTKTDDGFATELIGDFQNLSKRIPTPAITLSLLDPLPPGKILEFYIASPKSGPSPVPETPLLHHLSNFVPSVSIPLPLPIPLNHTWVRITAKIANEDLTNNNNNNNNNNVTTITNPTSKVDGIVVCFGDTHKFELFSDETMGSFLHRVTKRFNLNPREYELQDIHFMSYNDDTKLSDYTRTGGANVLRLVKKQITPPIDSRPLFIPQNQPPMFPGLNQQIGPFPINSPFNQK